MSTIKEEIRTETINGRTRKYKWYSTQVYIGTDKNGKRIYKRFSGRDKNEIMLMIAQAEEKEKSGGNKGERITLGQSITRYIENRESIVSPSTIKGYWVIRNQYLPELMDMYVDEINQDTIQCAFNAFAKSHSPKTCRNAHGLIAAALKINRPELVLHTTLPTLEKREIYVPDETEVENISKLISGNKLEIPFLLATQCGLRESEIAALNAVNISQDYIYIREARVNGIDGQVYKPPKSRSGYRKIPISPELSEFILFTAKSNGGHITSLTGEQISSSWTKFRIKHGINKSLNFHALRHHYASKCLLLGLPQKYIAELMGHSSTDMIEKVYQHIFPSAMEKYADIIREKMLKPRGTDNNIAKNATFNATCDE